MRLTSVRRPRVLLPVDHKWRDLPAYAYLKHLLEKKYRLDVALVRRGWERQYLALFRPDVVVYEALFYPEVTQLARDLSRLGVKIVILPTEGAPTSEPTKFRVAGKQYDYSMVDLFCSWNREIRDCILKLGTIPPEKVEITGGPRFDVYREPLNRLTSGREELFRRYRLNPKWPVLTFATNFIYASMADQNPEVMLRDWETLKAAQSGSDWYRHPQELADAERATRREMLTSIDRLKREIGNVNIVLRPHPGEDSSVYESFLRDHGYRDIPLVSMDYIWNLLSVTDVLISRASTVSYEAWFLDKPTVEFQLNPGDKSQHYLQEFGPGSDVARTHEELRALVSGYLKGGTLPDPIRLRRSEIIGKYFHCPDGRSSQRFAESLSRLLASMEFDPGKDARLMRRYGTGILRLAVQELRAFFRGPLMRHLFGSGPGFDYLGRKDRFIDPIDIRRWLRIIQAKRVV